MLVLVFFLVGKQCFGRNSDTMYILISSDLKNESDRTECRQTYMNESESRPYPILQFFRIKQKKNKKTAAAILAFPFPFGIVGLHRIYLGTSPHVPVVYIGTLGGVLGILPFIDFCVLLLDKDIDRFIENKKVLMWVDENKKSLK